jgi:hypothetical protein
VSEPWRLVGGPRRWLLVFALFAGSLAAVSTSRAAAPISGGQMTVYTTPLAQQFIDNNDDEARGDVNNPWGSHDTAASKTIDEHTDGPYPGDETLFAFGVYSSARLKGEVGSAVYTCQYYFAKNGFCDAEYQLAGGTVIAAGIVNFDAKSFALAVTGGYGKYDNASGDIEVSPVGKQAQRLSFSFD